MDETLRGTGRTSQAIVEAVLRASRGESVDYFSHTAQASSSHAEIARPIAELLGASVSARDHYGFPSGGSICFRRTGLQGMSSAKTHIYDHWVTEEALFRLEGLDK